MPNYDNIRSRNGSHNFGIGKIEKYFNRKYDLEK